MVNTIGIYIIGKCYSIIFINKIPDEIIYIIIKTTQ